MSFLSLVWPKLVLGVNEFCDSNGIVANVPDVNNVRVNTALGCIPVELNKLIGWALPFVLGIGGGIAFLLMIYGFILWATSEGDPKKIAGAQETVTSAIKGLLVCIFGLFILRLIALDILMIPGLIK